MPGLAFVRTFGTALVMAIGFLACEPSVPEDLPSLLRLMGSYDMNTSQAACRKVNRKYGEAGLLEGLRLGNDTARANAARWLAIGKHKSQPVIDGLLHASQDEDPYVRIWSVYALGEIGDPRTFPTLEHLQSDSSPAVADEARTTCEKLGLSIKPPAKQSGDKGKKNY